MDKVDIFNNIVKIFSISLLLVYVYLKIINAKEQKTYKIIIPITSFVLAIIYVLMKAMYREFVILFFIYFIYAIILSHISKKEWHYSMLITSISFIITYGIYIIPLFISNLLLKFFFDIKDNRNICIFLLSILMEYVILKKLFKIKRFKDGFNFLKKNDKIENIGLLTILLFLVILVISGIFDKEKLDYILTFSLFLLILAMTLVFFIWIRSRITKQYKENMQIRTIDIQKEELEEKDKIIEKLKEENMNLSSTIHKYNNRFGALQSAIIKTLNNSVNEEISTELNIMLKDLNKMSNNFTNEVTTATNKEINLPKTNIYEIDNIFQYMASMAEKDNIKLNLKINNNINGLIEKYVSKEDLATMIGDHIKDAIIAINHSNNDKKQIMVILGIVNGCYEFSIYDTGIEFEINTLLKLGKERVTTHKDEGGTGIGFMTTFETLNKCKGSIIIEEYDVESYYTKQITFKFDGLSEYKIHSYRESEIKEKDKQGRIIFY